MLNTFFEVQYNTVLFFWRIDNYEKNTHPIFLSIAFISITSAQESEQEKKVYAKRLEVSILPTYVYNAAKLGFSWSKNLKIENNLSLSFGNSQTHIISEASCKLQYNRNFIFKP